MGSGVTAAGPKEVRWNKQKLRLKVVVVVVVVVVVNVVVCKIR